MNIFLLAAGLLLIMWSLVDFKKTKTHEEKFNAKFAKAIEETDDIDIRIGKLRSEFSETILELQKEIYELKDEQKFKEDVHKKFSEKPDVYIKHTKTSFDTPNIEKSSEGKNDESSNNIDMIKNFIKEGMSVDEICEKTKMNKGEILLVKELYL